MTHHSDLIDDNKTCLLISFDGKMSLLNAYATVFRSFNIYWSGKQKQDMMPCGILLRLGEIRLLEMRSCQAYTLQILWKTCVLPVLRQDLLLHIIATDADEAVLAPGGILVVGSHESITQG